MFNENKPGKGKGAVIVGTAQRCAESAVGGFVGKLVGGFASELAAGCSIGWCVVGGVGAGAGVAPLRSGSSRDGGRMTVSMA